MSESSVFLYFAGEFGDTIVNALSDAMDGVPNTASFWCNEAGEYNELVE